MTRSRDEVAELVLVGLDLLSVKDPKLFQAYTLTEKVDSAIAAILEDRDSQVPDMIEEYGEEMLSAKSLR